MYELKKVPEDFMVEEVPVREFEEDGVYLICLMKKTNYNTEDAVQALSKALSVSRKNISYAGTKDRNAITYQYISLFKGTKERIQNLKLKDISLQIKGRSNAPLSLGDLKGNKFEITVRDLEPDTKISKIDKFPNYFDKQRFSVQNVDIGRAIVKKDYKEACNLIANDFQYGGMIKKELNKESSNYTRALQKMPIKILLIFVHAYQSLLWNKTVEEYLKTNKNNRETIPLIGFTDLDEDELKPILENIMKEEGITNRDFIIREIPHISLEGTERKLYMNIENLEIGEFLDDELNKGKKKVKIKFFLEKGSYATMAIKHLFS
jgi:tRNA pseudouridine13 synthase